MILATFYVPSSHPLSLVSPVSLGVLFAAISCAFIFHRTRSLREQQWAFALAAIGAPAAAVFFLLQRYPSTDVLAACVICLAFGFGFSLSALRGPQLIPMLMGFGSSLVTFGIVLLMLVGGALELLHEYRSDEPFGIPALILGTIVWLAWLAGGFMLAQRQRKNAFVAEQLGRGCCSHCHYDLRGSRGHPVCPECGTKIQWDKVKLPAAGAD